MTYQEWETRVWRQGVTMEEAREAMGIDSEEFQLWPERIWVEPTAVEWLLALEKESRDL
jgi:hypothetical protein